MTDRPTDPVPGHKPSESQQIRAVSMDLESSRDALANARGALRPGDYQGRMLIEILARSLDQAELQTIALERLARIESEQASAKEERQTDRRRIEALEMLVDGAVVDG